MLLVNQDGNADFVKIIDFGIAKDMRAVPNLQLSGPMRISSAALALQTEAAPAQTDESELSQDTPEAGLTQAGQLVGTPLYMAPEQIRSGVHDKKGDQYAVGCMLYFMLTGQPVFSGVRPDEVMTAHVKRPVVPPRQRMAGLRIGDALEALVLKALAKNPEDRFESMRALEMALEASIAQQTPGLPRRRLAQVLGALVGLSVIVSVLVWSVLRTHDQEVSQKELLSIRARALAELQRQAAGQPLRQKLSALRAIGHSRDGAQRPLLQKYLSENEPKVVAHAAEALGLLGDPEAASVLLARVGVTVEPTAKTALAVALERLGEPKGTQLLYEGLVGKDPDVRLLSALTLCERGNRAAVELLVSVLEKGQVGGPIEWPVLGCLARSGHEPARKALLAKLQRPDPRDAQLQAARELLLLAEPRAQSLLEKLAAEPGRDQLLAAHKLASPEYPQTAQVFRVVLSDSEASPGAQILATEGLGLCGQLADVRALDAVLQKTGDQQVKLSAAEAIVRLAATDVRLMSERSLLWARDALASSSWSIREAGLASLGDRTEDEAAKLIVSMLKDPVAQVRKAAVRALARRDTELALDHLQSQLSDADSSVRLESLQSLVRLAKRLLDSGQRPAAEKVSGWLRDLLQRGSLSEQVVARHGLYLLGDGGQKNALRDGIATADDETRRLLVGQPGLDKELLRAFLSDRNEDIRFAAARRLAERGDPEAKTVLQKAVQKGDGDSLTASVLLRRLGENTGPLVLPQNNSVPVEKRMLLVESVQHLDPSIAVPVLLQAAKDPEPLVRRLAVEIASDLQGTADNPAPGLPVLRFLSKDGDPAVRARVFGILWRLQGQKADLDGKTPAVTEQKAVAASPKVDATTKQTPLPTDSGTPGVQTGSPGKLMIEAAPGTLVQIDDLPWQTPGRAGLGLAAGKHTLRSLSGEQTFEILPSQTRVVRLPVSPAERTVSQGIDLLEKADYRRAHKLFDRALDQCKKDKTLAVPCDGLAFEAGFHLAQALENGHLPAEAMAQYQKLQKFLARTKSQPDRRGDMQASIARLSKVLGEVVISERKKNKCQQSSLWVLPGTHIVSVGGRSQSLQVSAQQKISVGSCD